MPSDALTELTTAIGQGLAAPSGSMRPAIEKMFGERYQKRHLERHAERVSMRDAYALADGEGGVPYAGLINPDNPPSGPYGGTSIVWFPSEDRGSLEYGQFHAELRSQLFVRRITALRRYLARRGVDCDFRSAKDG